MVITKGKRGGGMNQELGLIYIGYYTSNGQPAKTCYITAQGTLLSILQ